MNLLDAILQWDQRLFLAINSWSGSWFDYVFGWTTFLGENAVCLILIGAFLWIWDRENFRERFLNLAIWVLILGILVHFIKEGIDRPRPYNFFNHDFQSGLVRVNYLYQMILAKSFPSGHAGLLFMTAAILIHHYGPRVGFLFYSLAFLISFTRVYVGAHFPLDVIGGALLGHLVGILAIKVNGASLKNK